MYERMLNKQVVPSIAEMTEYCAENAGRFSMVNDWLANTFHTERKVVFPYGSHYGWGIGHYRKKKLICNIFPEAGAFTVMLRLTDTQIEAVYDQVDGYTQGRIDSKYPCGDGGWVHYRVACQAHYEDIKSLLARKCQS